MHTYIICVYKIGEDTWAPLCEPPAPVSSPIFPCVLPYFLYTYLSSACPCVLHYFPLFSHVSYPIFYTHICEPPAPVSSPIFIYTYYICMYIFISTYCMCMYSLARAFRNHLIIASTTHINRALINPQHYWSWEDSPSASCWRKKTKSPCLLLHRRRQYRRSLKRTALLLGTKILQF
jgi:hypothetical protein